MAFGFLKKAVNAVGKAAGSVVKNPLVKMVAGGVAVVFPPVGMPIAAGIAISDKVLREVNSKNPQKKAAGNAVVRNTMDLAAKGSVGASNALTLMNKRAAALREARKYQVDTRGCVRRKVA